MDPGPEVVDNMPLPSNEDAAAAVAASREKEENDSLTNFNPGIWFYMAFVTLAVLTLIVALDGTALSVALPIISRQLHGTALEAFWVGTSFLLTSTVFQPNICSFSHIFGRKPLMIISVVLFLAGVLTSALAKNFTTLLVGRSIQGIGGGGIVVLTEIVVCDLVPLRLRGQWLGVVNGTYAIGTVAGPLIGGAFSQHVTWRWIFYINLPFVGIGIILVPLFIRLEVFPSTLRSKLARLDLIGSVLFIASSTSFLIPLSWGGVQYPWGSYHTLVPLILGAAGLVGFYFYEEHVSTEPVIRMIIFKNRNAAIAYSGDVIQSVVVFALLYYLPLYYEGIKGLSATTSGVALFPETFTVAPAAVVVGAAITKTGRYRWAVWSGWAITVLGLGILYLLDVNTSTVQWIFLNLCAGLGTGFLYPALAFTLQSATSDEDMAFGVAMFSVLRVAGQALGVAIGGVIFQNQMQRNLRGYPELASQAVDLSKDASALAQIIQGMPLGQTRTDLSQAYADALKVIWAVMCGLSALGLLSSLFVRELSLDRLLVSPQQLAAIKKKAVVDEEKTESAARSEEGVLA